MPSPTFEIVWARNSFRNSGRRRTARFPRAAGRASVIAGLLGLGHAVQGDEEAERDGARIGGGAVVLAHELQEPGLELAGLGRRQHRQTAAHDRALRVALAAGREVGARVVLEVRAEGLGDLLPRGVEDTPQEIAARLLDARALAAEQRAVEAERQGGDSVARLDD